MQSLAHLGVQLLLFGLGLELSLTKLRAVWGVAVIGEWGWPAGAGGGGGRGKGGKGCGGVRGEERRRHAARGDRGISRPPPLVIGP